MLTVFVTSPFSSGSAEYLTHKYGEAEGEIWVEDLQCTGEETTLLQCEMSDFGAHACDHSEDVSIFCSDTPGAVKVKSKEISSNERFNYKESVINKLQGRTDLSALFVHWITLELT